VSRVAAKELAVLEPGVDGHIGDGTTSHTDHPERRLSQHDWEDCLVVVPFFIYILEGSNNPDPHEAEDEEEEVGQVKVIRHCDQDHVVCKDHLEH